MKPLFQAVLCGTFMLGGTLLAGTPVVLLQDNFNANTGGTTDLNGDLGRQTGFFAPVSYAMAGGPGNYGHQLQNGNAANQLLLADFGQSTSALDFDFAGNHAAGGLKISFDLDSMPTVYGGGADNWGCLNLGLAAADRLANVNDGVAHFGVLFRAAGTLQAFDSGTTVSPGTEPVYSTQPAGTTNHIDIVLTDTDGNPFDDYGNTQIDIYANGGTTPVWSFTKAGGYAHNFINVQGSWRAHLDNLTVTQLDPPSAPSNPWTYTAWSTDGSSGVSDAFPYTHAYNFGSANGTVINGVTFTGVPGGNPSVAGRFSLSGVPSLYNGDTANNVTGAGGVMARDFIYGGNPGVLTLDGLNPGTAYVLSFYSTAWEGAGNRRITFSAGNDFRNIDQDAFGAAGRAGLVISYGYVANASSMTVTMSPVVAGNSFHIYGFSNRETTPMPRAPMITAQPQGISVAEGLDVTLRVEAIGEPAPSYCWLKDGVVIEPSQSGAALVLSAVTPLAQGAYQVVVSNSLASVTSLVATVKVGMPMANPSFEVDTFTNSPGYVGGNFPITGWTSSAARNGVNPGVGFSPFADNGAIPHGRQVAFMQDVSVLSQTVSGFTVGQQYYVEFYENARNCCGGVAALAVTIDDGLNPTLTILPAHPVAAVGGANPYRRMETVGFTAAAGSLTLSFLKSDLQSGDSTVLLDSVCLLPLPAGTPPRIFSQPQSARADLSSTVTLNVFASGSSPLAYQWLKNGVPLAGANAATLPLRYLTQNDDADYSVILTNTGGSATSAVAHLTVLLPLLNRGLFNTGVDENGAPLAAAATDPHYAIMVNPDSASVDALAQNAGVPISPDGPWLANSALSKWIGPRADTAAAAGGDYTYSTTLDLTGRDPSAVIIEGHWASDNEGLNIVVNGVDLGLSNGGDYGTWTPFTLTTASAGFSAGVNSIDFKVRNASVGYTGLRVEFTRTHAPLGSGTAPVIILDPKDRQAAVGDTVTLVGNGVGSLPLCFQWCKNGVPLPNQTGPALTLTGLTAADSALYALIVSNAVGTATSAVATVCVNLLPVPGIFGTGVDDAGQLLPNGVPDPHYILSASADTNYPGPDAVVVLDNQFPIPPWLASGPGSKWIGPRADQGPGNAEGGYTYTTAFDLSGVDLSRFKLMGQWAVDNLGLDILINGVSTGLTAGGFDSPVPFTISRGFVDGMNTLDFVTTNLPPVGPTGLRVDLRGYLTLPPEVTVPPRLTLTRSGQNLILSWTPASICQRLYAAPTITGPWTEVLRASNPYVTAATNAMSFFRVAE